MTSQKSKIGLIAGFCIAVGAAIGGGLWVNPVVAASIGGPIVLPLLILTMVPIVLAIPGYAMLAKVWPVTPGHYYYLTRFLSPKNKSTSQFLGWTALWPWMIISVSIAFVQVSLGAANYLSNLFPIVPFQLHQIALILFTVAIVWFGLRAVGWVEIALVSMLFLSLFIMVIFGIPSMNPDNFTPITPSGFIGATGAAALVAGSTANGFLIIDLSSEVRNAEDSVPKILLSAIITNGLIAILIVLLAVSIVPSSQLAGQTLVFVTEKYLPGVLGLFPILGALLASITTTITFVLLFNRYSVAASKDGILPSWTQKENSHEEPVFNLLATGILAIGVVIADLPIGSLSYGSILAVMSLPLLVSIASLRFTYEYEWMFEQEPLANSRILRPKLVRGSSLLSVISIAGLFVFGSVENPLGFVLYIVALSSGAAIFGIRWLIGGKKQVVDHKEWENIINDVTNR